MSSSELGLIIRWLLPLWIFGWALWPLSRRVFPFLTDGGLAAGRLLVLVGATLVSFWLAALRVVPFGVTPFLLLIVALVGATWWRHSESRRSARESWRALLVSDAVFLLGFAFFLWVRLRNPSVGDLEKPMDAMLLSGAANADFLPFEHLWLSGEKFTNYYYFGPLLGGALMKAFSTPTWLAYNLVHPLFCAFFLSVGWSVAAALIRSNKLGLAATTLVALGGHLEPLRQLSSGTSLGELDWWKTSRVVQTVVDGRPIEGSTINEYPAFTLLIADLHAHFYALSLAVLHFAICFGIVRTGNRLLIFLGGAMLSVFALTNTWDAPLYGLLWALSVLVAARSQEKNAQNRLIRSAVVGVLSAIVFALPYFWKFRSPVSGVEFALWRPDVLGLVLFWGGWFYLGIAAWAFGRRFDDREANFRLLLLGVGLLAFALPFVFYIRGVFAETDYRHIDTVFKFWLQAWLLIGFAVSTELGTRLRDGWPRWSRLAKAGVGMGTVLAAMVLLLAPYATLKARAFDQGSSDLSLSGMRFLPEADQAAIRWLNDKNGVVLEAVRVDESGAIGGDYDAQFGRVSALTGRPTVLAWPGHVSGWGGNTGTRGQQIADFYRAPSPDASILKEYNVRWIFWGTAERILAPLPPDLPFQKHEFRGEDGSLAIVYEVADVK